MSNPEADDSDQLEAILAEYLAAAERGSPPSPDELLAQYPHWSTELRQFLADKQWTDRCAGEGIEHRASDAAQGIPKPPVVRQLNVANSASAASGPLVGESVSYFGDYEILEEIARGGMGVVYRARQVSLNRIVALKMILGGPLAGQADIKRFQTEAEAAANLDHPGIAPIYEVGEHKGQHYFSMAFVEGRSLSEHLAEGPFQPRQAAELLGLVAEAIAYAHNRGVIHRDLKPGNILLDKTDQPRVTDFGLAKRVEGESDLTATGQVLGTPSFMPPEQASGKVETIDERSDVYSLGAVLYALLTGHPPFQSANPIDTLMQVLEKDPVSPRHLNPQVPADLSTICLKSLSKDQHRRYQSAAELAQDLRRFLHGESIKARPVGVIERSARWARRNPGRAAIFLFLAVVFLLPVVLYNTWPRSTSTFFDAFDDETVIQKVCRQAGGTFVGDYKASNGGGSTSWSPWFSQMYREKRIEIDFAHPTKQSMHRVTQTLREEVERLLEEHGCRLRGYGRGSAHHALLPGSTFSFRYEKGRNIGRIRMMCFTEEHVVISGQGRLSWYMVIEIVEN